MLPCLMASSANATASTPGVDRAREPASRSLLEAGREAGLLDLDFASPDRPALVTQVLGLVWAGDEAALWQLSVGTRLKRLLQITRETTRTAALSLRLNCSGPGCREILEVELSFSDLDPLHDEAADGELLRFPGDSAVALRRPTGDDLRRWRAEGAHPDTLFLDLATNRAASPLPPAEVCAAALSEFDALVGFEVLTECPQCRKRTSLPVDLETLALRQLEAVQQGLFAENHRLASAYGWSEADILAVPRRRRLRYLATLEAKA